MQGAFDVGNQSVQRSIWAANTRGSGGSQNMWSMLGQQAPESSRSQANSALLAVTSTASLTANTVIAAEGVEKQAERSSILVPVVRQDPVTRTFILDVLRRQPRFEQLTSIRPTPSATAAAQPSRQQKPKGHIQWLGRILKNWHVTDDQAQILLGLNSAAELDRVVNGADVPLGRDISDRIRYLLLVDEALSNLYRHEEKERAWLGRPNQALSGRSPLSLMLDGSMRSLIMVKELLDFASGR